jgi:hypothetical protein
MTPFISIFLLMICPSSCPITNLNSSSSRAFTRPEFKLTRWGSPSSSLEEADALKSGAFEIKNSTGSVKFRASQTSLNGLYSLGSKSFPSLKLWPSSRYL